ncbi:MAG: hypothetical protein NVS1B4_09600 [Gemmatimonadaceae bacterium]
MTTPCHTERRMVSRKTPADGRLEISHDLASRLESAKETGLTLAFAGGTDDAHVASFACTCGKADARGQHHHFFLESTLLLRLTPGHEVTVSYDSGARLVSVSV